MSAGFGSRRHDGADVGSSPEPIGRSPEFDADLTDPVPGLVAEPDEWQTMTALIDSSPAGVALFDTRLSCRRANPAFAELSGYRRDDLVRVSLAGALPPGTPDAVLRTLRSPLLDGEPVIDVELPSGPPGTGTRWRVTSYPLRLANGRVVGLGLHVVDGIGASSVDSSVKVLPLTMPQQSLTDTPAAAAGSTVGRPRPVRPVGARLDLARRGRVAISRARVNGERTVDLQRRAAALRVEAAAQRGARRALPHKRSASGV